MDRFIGYVEVYEVCACLLANRGVAVVVVRRMEGVVVCWREVVGGSLSRGCRGRQVRVLSRPDGGVDDCPKNAM